MADELISDAYPVKTKRFIDQVDGDTYAIDWIQDIYAELECSEPTLEVHKHNHAMRSERYSENKLRETFSNGAELVEWVKTLFNDGFTKLLKQGNKSYLVNTEGNGYHLQRRLIREYAEALIKTSEFESLLA